MNKQLCKVTVAVSCLMMPVAFYACASSKITFLNWNAFGESVQIKGRLGVPLGHVVTIEGVSVRQKARPDSAQYYLLIEKLNGKKLKDPISVWIEDPKKLSDSKRYIFKGYETGGMVGTPYEGLRQGDKVRLYFVVNFVVTETVLTAAAKK